MGAALNGLQTGPLFIAALWQTHAPGCKAALGGAP